MSERSLLPETFKFCGGCHIAIFCSVYVHREHAFVPSETRGSNTIRAYIFHSL